MTEIIFRSDVVTSLRDSMPRKNGDESIIEAMLVSTDKHELVQEMLEIPKTAGRIRFLMRKKHGTPFEHNAMKFYVEAPIFVFREWHRHRIGQSYNEQSGRYSELPPMFYLPPRERPLQQVGKPGEYQFVPGSEMQYSHLMAEMKDSCTRTYNKYQYLLSIGIAKEVARMILPVNIYSKMFCTMNARSLMSFLSLRTNEPESTFPSTPMYEIELCARLAEEALATLFPLTYEAFNEYGRVAP